MLSNSTTTRKHLLDYANFIFAFVLKHLCTPFPGKIHIIKVLLWAIVLLSIGRGRKGKGKVLGKAWSSVSQPIRVGDLMQTINVGQEQTQVVDWGPPGPFSLISFFSE